MDRLLKILDENCNYTVQQLAAMLGCSEAEVKNQISVYEKQGVIRGYKAIVDWEKTNRDYVAALIEIRVSPKANQGFDEIASKILKFPEVKSLSLMSGGFDLCATVVGKSLKDVAFFVSGKLGVLDSVLSTATHFMLKNYKSGGFGTLEEQKDERGQMAL